MLESKFKTKLIDKLRLLFPGAIIAHLDANETQGIPDLIILYGEHWAALEGKRSPTSPKQPNQEWYVEKMNRMSFAAFINPQNMEEVLYAIQRAFKTRR